MSRPPAKLAGSMTGLALVVGAFTGAAVALQGRVNGSAGEAGLGSIMASWLSYVGTVISIVLVIVLSGRWAHTWRTLRSKGAWWWFAIGCCGMPIVISMAAGIPIIGVAMASVCSVAGQTVSGLILDAKGIGIDTPLRLTARRLLAGLFAVAGLAVVVVTAPVPDDSTPLIVGLMAVFLFVSGFILSGQQAGNGQVASIAGDPLIPTLTACSGGTVGITLVALVAKLGGWLPTVTWPAFPEHWLLYLGGPLGAIITVGSAWSVRHIGTFALSLAIIGGQMVGAVLLDLASAMGVSWATFVAIAAVAGSVLLAMSRPGPRGAPDDAAAHLEKHRT